MSYVIRVKGGKKGWIFANGYNDWGMPYPIINCEKFKYADEYATTEEANEWLSQFNDRDDFEVVSYNTASWEYYGDEHDQ